MSVRSIKTLFVGASFVGVAPTLGCAAKARITQFSNFATASQAYIQAADKLIDEAAVSNMEVSSISLKENREALSEPDRYESLRRSRDRDLKQVSELFLIKKYNRLLNTYFQGINSVVSASAASFSLWSTSS